MQNWVLLTSVTLCFNMLLGRENFPDKRCSTETFIALDTLFSETPRIWTTFEKTHKTTNQPTTKSSKTNKKTLRAWVLRYLPVCSNVFISKELSSRDSWSCQWKFVVTTFLKQDANFSPIYRFSLAVHNIFISLDSLFKTNLFYHGIFNIVDLHVICPGCITTPALIQCMLEKLHIGSGNINKKF